MKNILFPTDLSPHARSVFEFALVIARKMGASIRLYSAYGKPADRFDTEISVEERGRILLKNLKDFVAKNLPESYQDIPFEYEVEVSYPGEGVIRATEKHQPDLVIMGMNDQAEISGVIIGSVARDVIKNAECPVLAIPGGVTFEKMKSFVYATDFEFEDLIVLNTLRDWSVLFDAEVYCLHVVESNEDEGEVNTKMDVLRHTYRHSPDIHFDVRKGKLGATLDEYADEKDADLLVMLTRRRGWLDQLFNPSQAVKVARSGDTPVLVFRD